MESNTNPVAGHAASLFLFGPGYTRVHGGEMNGDSGTTCEEQRDSTFGEHRPRSWHHQVLGSVVELAIGDSDTGHNFCGLYGSKPT